MRLPQTSPGPQAPWHGPRTPLPGRWQLGGFQVICGEGVGTEAPYVLYVHSSSSRACVYT